MTTQITITNENNISVIGVTDESQKYFLWQSSDDEKDNIHFEYNDQINSGYNIIKECTVMPDGIHIVLTSGELLYFYFSNLSNTDYKKFINALEKTYSNQPERLQIIDK